VKAVAEKAPALSARDCVLCALFAALIAVGAFLRVPLPIVPFTLQLPFVCLAGLLLGPRRGAIAVILYIFMALPGYRVHPGGGPGYVIRPTFGYLLGFVPAAALTARSGQGASASAGCLPRPLPGFWLRTPPESLLCNTGGNRAAGAVDPGKIAAAFFLNTIGGDLLSLALFCSCRKRLRRALPQM
jgi:biotin transporter BioY